MSQELLESRWGETKEALLEGLQGARRSTMGVILENTRKHLAENASADLLHQVTLQLLTELFYLLSDVLCQLLLPTN